MEPRNQRVRSGVAFQVPCTGIEGSGTTSSRIMIDDGIEGGNTAVVHLWRCERNVAEGRRSEFAHVLTPPGNPLHASVGLRVGTPSVLAIEPGVVEPHLRCF
jgi:hypothetical protein